MLVVDWFSLLKIITEIYSTLSFGNIRCLIFFMSTISAKSWTFIWRSLNIILWISFIMSGLIISFCRSLQCLLWQLVWPRLNSSSHNLVVVNNGPIFLIITAICPFVQILLGWPSYILRTKKGWPEWTWEAFLSLVSGIRTDNWRDI